MMEIDMLKEAISAKEEGVPIGLNWKVILPRTQGMIPKAQKIKALHSYVNKLDVTLAKPLLTTLYASKTMDDHEFCLVFKCAWSPKLTQS